MAIADPRLHIICGICGNNKELEWEHTPGDDSCPDDVHPEDVRITCRNCGSLTGLLEVMPHRGEIRGASCKDNADDPPEKSYPCCGNCATPRRMFPVAGHYTTCPHIGLAIEEAEFDVSAESRFCIHHCRDKK